MTNTEFSHKLTKNLDKTLTTINGDQHPRYGHGIRVSRRYKSYQGRAVPLNSGYAMVYFNNGKPETINHGLKSAQLALVKKAVDASLQ